VSRYNTFELQRKPPIREQGQIVFVNVLAIVIVFRARGT
jgi:hypothetical protein